MRYFIPLLFLFAQQVYAAEDCEHGNLFNKTVLEALIGQSLNIEKSFNVRSDEHSISTKEGDPVLCAFSRYRVAKGLNYKFNEGAKLEIVKVNPMSSSVEIILKVDGYGNKFMLSCRSSIPGKLTIQDVNKALVRSSKKKERWATLDCPDYTKQSAETSQIEESNVKILPNDKKTKKIRHLNQENSTPAT